jgi:glyoxylase-like metal-dependent hydrolase (beta-lactamase superfamily II)
MRRPRLAPRSLALLAVAVLAPSTAVPEEIAPGVTLLPGRFVQGTQPDGNTVVLRAPDGLLVVDTGRHAAHTQRILDLAAGLATPIAAVLNTHWHLDHVGGNPRIRKAHPEARVWGSPAILEARTGFLATYRKQLLEVMAATDDPAARLRFQDEVAIIDAGPALLPDELVRASGPRIIAGRALELGVETRAVTAADVWVLDPATGVLAAGDLVTLPVPLLDTACPRGWQAALGRLAAARFQLLVPGHGRPMRRADLETYRAGFDHLLACAASERPGQACIDGWLADLSPLVPAAERELATSLLRYYVASHLRAPGKIAELCGAEIGGGSRP